MSIDVELDQFAGPLDLLLYLIRRDEIDIHDIPVAHITREYLTALEQMEELDIRVGGEFLVVASMLLELKSQMTLVRGQRTPGDGQKDQIDPRYELVRQLLEYRRIKDGTTLLLDLERAQSERFFHPTSPAEISAAATSGAPAAPPSGYLKADLWDLVAAYGRLLNSLGTRQPLQIPYDDTPIEVYTERLLARAEASAAEGRGPARFRDCLHAGGVHELVGLFLALLELLKQRKVHAWQEQAFGEICLAPATRENLADGDVDGDDLDDEMLHDEDLPAPPEDPSRN